MMYNLSEFITVLKEDIGIKDVPLPVDDNALGERIVHSALAEFSARYPLITTAQINGDCIVDASRRDLYAAVTYQIPKKYYNGSYIIAVLSIDNSGIGSEGNFFMPMVTMGGADRLISSIADIKMAASIGSQMVHAPTFRFDKPDRLTIFNGWAESNYNVEIGVAHDPSLATIPDTALTDFRHLAGLDLKWYLYNKLRRTTDIDTGVGTINLRIDNWENAESEFRDLLKEWDETASLDVSMINYW